MPRRPLIEVLAEVPDGRKAQGKRYPLHAILALAVVATLCGYRSYGAMAEWGRNYGARCVKALGFVNERTPCAATFFLVFHSLDMQAFETAVNGWVDEVLMEHGDEVYAIDGKTLRGSKKQGATGAHLLSVVSHKLGVTLRHEAVDDKTNELGAIFPLLEKLVIAGRLLSMDALFTQRDIAAYIMEHQGDYIQVAKDNQPGLKDAIEAVLSTPSHIAAPIRIAHTRDTGHGRREDRTIMARDLLSGDSDWPGISQVFRIERTIVIKKTGEIHRDAILGLTSRASTRTSARQLLMHLRAHWVIENRSHYVRDVTFDEDRSQVRTGTIHHALATIRTTAISLMRLSGYENIAAACRTHAAQPSVALSLIGASL